jgi:hypothetical protein
MLLPGYFIKSKRSPESRRAARARVRHATTPQIAVCVLCVLELIQLVVVVNRRGGNVKVLCGLTIICPTAEPTTAEVLLPFELNVANDEGEVYKHRVLDHVRALYHNVPRVFEAGVPAPILFNLPNCAICKAGELNDGRLPQRKRFDGLRQDVVIFVLDLPFHLEREHLHFIFELVCDLVIAIVDQVLEPRIVPGAHVLRHLIAILGHAVIAAVFHHFRVCELHGRGICVRGADGIAARVVFESRRS